MEAVGRDGPLDGVEEFVCHLYDAPDLAGGVNKARHDLFRNGRKELNKLPPTQDALLLHFQRVNYQAKVWLCANQQNTIGNAGLPEDSGGWYRADEGLLIKWKTLQAVPIECLELVSCSCKIKCKSAACKCAKADQVCTPACGCEGENCSNPS